MKYQVCRPLTPIEYECLKADIAEHGVLVPVELDEEGEILDGHHRVQAWAELVGEGVDVADYPTITRTGLTEEAKRNHARRLNLMRRQMTDEEQVQIRRDMRADGKSYQAIADETGVSYGTAYTQTRDVELIKIDKVNGRDGKTYPASYRTNGDALPPALPLPAWAEEDEPDPVYRYNGGLAYCKYCYETHDDWEFSGDHEPPAWICGRCEHATADMFMGVLDDSPTETIEERWERLGKEEKFGNSTPDPMAVHYSSETAEHYTPRHIVEMVNECLGEIDLDPCSNSHDAPNVPADLHYTAEDDGLTQEWRGRVYMNPPYGRQIGEWIDKLCAEYTAGNVTEAIALVPARVDTQWWVRLNEAHPFVCFVMGRLSFVGNDNNAPFPSALVYLGSNFEKFYYTFVGLGDVYQRLNAEMFGS